MVYLSIGLDFFFFCCCYCSFFLFVFDASSLRLFFFLHSDDFALCVYMLLFHERSSEYGGQNANQQSFVPKFLSPSSIKPKKKKQQQQHQKKHTHTVEADNDENSCYLCSFLVISSEILQLIVVVCMSVKSLNCTSVSCVQN